jgi:hypothetical protein
MISLAAVMSKPVSRGAPCARPPRPVITFLRFRSFMSMQRRQEIASGSRPDALPWWRCASISAASRLFAAVIACRSPVK